MLERNVEEKVRKECRREGKGREIGAESRKTEREERNQRKRRRIKIRKEG